MLRLQNMKNMQNMLFTPRMRCPCRRAMAVVDIFLLRLSRGGGFFGCTAVKFVVFSSGNVYHAVPRRKGLRLSWLYQ